MAMALVSQCFFHYTQLHVVPQLVKSMLRSQYITK
jgi:hypothetical protein